MIDKGKRSVLGVLVNVIDYEAAVATIVAAARAGRGLAVSALAVHGVITGLADAEQRYRLNHLDLVVPDGQPVRWALNLLYGIGLRQRVYGPDLTLRVYAEAERHGLGVYLYGSTTATLERLQTNLRQRFPYLPIVGAEPSQFRRLSAAEQQALNERIRATGARIVCVGLGCPRQEVWAYEQRDQLGAAILAVGAAFDFHAGSQQQAPHWMQERGLEWLFRLSSEPRRLWRRYLLLNPLYLTQLLFQKLRLKDFDILGVRPANAQRYG